MKILFLLFALISLVWGQGTSFKASLAIRNDPAIMGTLTGVINYDLIAQRLRIDYSPPISVSEFFEFSTLTNVRYLVCSTTCQAETIKTTIPRLVKESGDTATGNQATVNGRLCTQYNKANTAGGVTSIFVDANNFPCQATFSTGKVFDFTNPMAVDSASFGQRPTTCPTPVCTRKQDMMLVFDESGSIDPASFQSEKNFGISLANSFTFGPQNAAMGLVQFDTDARLTIPLTQDRTSFVNQMGVVFQRGRNTCIGCGIILAQQELFSVRSRPGVTKVMVILTDGLNNVNPPGSDLPTADQNAKNAGIVIAGIAVAQADPNQVSALTSGPNFFFSSPNFFGLNQLVNGLSQVTCTDIVGNPCGPGCKGFCICNQQCVCPQLCETTNQCVSPVCNNNQNGAGCQYPPKVCTDNNLCTTDTCNIASGCQFTPISCDDGNVCTTDSCNPAAGCSHQTIDCNKPNPCFTYGCNPSTGCFNTSIFCDKCAFLNVTCPPISCQINKCNPPTGQCVATPKVCNSNSKCIIDGCANDVCTQTPVNCDDGNACTVDTCDPNTGCIHTPINVPVACNDSSVCTADSCDPAKGCVNTPIPCNATGNACLTSVCNSLLGCQVQNVDCGAVLRGIDPNKQGNCYVAACDPNTGCFLSQIPGTTVDQCGFCAAPGTQSQFCFLGLNVNQTAGLGAGIIAAIVIGVVAAVVIAIISGKKGYDVWRKNRQNMQGAQTSPMYVDPGRSGNNPFFEQKA